MAESDVPEKKHVRIADDVGKDEEEEVATSPKPKTPKSILIAVDGSGPSNHAAEWYLEELHRPGDTVIFLHCFELPLMHSYQEMYATPDLWQATIKKEADRTSQMEKIMMRKLKCRQISGKFLAEGGGKPGESVLRVAEEHDVDMIVMGTRGHGRIMRALLGSVSHYVMSHANCPVMVYRNKKVKGKNAKKDAKEKAEDPEQTEDDQHIKED